MISIIISVYNEEDILEKNIKILEKYFNSNIIENYEIIITNDGSTDNTAKISKTLINNHIKFIGYSKNKGRGYALKYSSKFINGKYILFMDLDLPSSMDLNAIERMIYYLKEYDIVIGSRYMKGSKVKRKIYRMAMTYIYRKIISLLFPFLKISDTDMGFKGFKTIVFKDLCKKIKEDSWSWDLEMLILADKIDYKVKELPVSWVEEGNSRFGNFIGPLKQLLATIRLIYRYF